MYFDWIIAGDSKESELILIYVEIENMAAHPGLLYCRAHLPEGHVFQLKDKRGWLIGEAKIPPALVRLDRDLWLSKKTHLLITKLHYGQEERTEPMPTFERRDNPYYHPLTTGYERP